MAQNGKSENLLFDSLPKTIVCDTNFITFSLNKTQKDLYKNLACRYFLEKLLNSPTVIYMSSLIFPEFWHATLKIAIGKKYDTESELEINRILSQDKKKVIGECSKEIIRQQRQFDKLLSKFTVEGRLFIVETSNEIMMEAEKHLVNYRLLSYDAIHLATMTVEIRGEPYKPKIADMVTLDRDIIEDCCKDYDIWHKGCDFQSIIRYERTLPKDELEPDSLLKSSQI